MKPAFLLFSLCLLPTFVDAQGFFRGRGPDKEDEIPLLTPQERKTVESQRDEFANAFGPALKTASQSTVRIFYKTARGQDIRAAYGTVIGDGTKILTKWSEVANAVDDFRAGTIGSEVRPVKVTGVYPEEDIAVLTIEGEPLTPVKWTETPLELGNFLVASQPDGRPAGYGVVSVLERSLRAGDQGYLGVDAELEYDGPGVRIKSVRKGTGAEAAGLKPGEVILKVGDRDITGPLALQNALWGAKPGTEIDLLMRVEGKDDSVKVVLGGRPELKQFAGDRLLQMERMGSKRLSKVREGFPRVVETDMVLEVESIGGPVANLKGEVIGVTMSRAGRTRSYVMTAPAIEEMLKKDATSPALALQQQRDQQSALRALAREERENSPAPKMQQMGRDEFENLKRHQGDMARLMDRIESELQALERGE